MRAFLGLEIPDDLRAALERELAPIRGRFPSARWVPAANWHLTLVFLGEVEEAGLERLDRALPEVFADHGGFELEFREAGTFPPGRPGRVVWLGVRVPQALRRLQAAVAQVCGGAGFEIESRPYSPHLTLARCRRPWPRGAVESWTESDVGGSLESRRFAVTRGCLFESRFVERGGRRRGVVYEVIRSYPLGHRAP